MLRKHIGERHRARALPIECLRAVLFLIIVLHFSVSCSRNINAGTTYKSTRNSAAVENAKSNIEKFRKGKASIRFRGMSNDAAVHIRQISHDFKFGCYLKLDDLDPNDFETYESAFSGLFNYAVVGTYWDFTEPTRDQPNWTWFDRELAFATRIGARTAAAPILWGTNEYGTPKWLPRDAVQLRNAIDNRIESAMNRSELPDDWEIVNEPFGNKTDFFAENAGASYIESAFRTARRVAPGKRLMINEFGFFGNETKNNFNKDRYFNLLKDLISKGTPIDIIGMQAHSNGEWYEPANIAETLARYASLGKPLQITEFSAPTRRFDSPKRPLGIGGSYRKGSWNDDLQAEYYREFFTVAFGEPSVEAIVTWGLDDKRAWLPGIGLIDGTDRKKPNYRTLDQLINGEWRTDLVIRPANGAPIEFRGFFGKYEVTVTDRGKVVRKIFNLAKNSGNDWLIELYKD